MTAVRAGKTELERIFRKYATVQKGEEWFMSQEDFVCHYLQLVDSSTPSEVVQLLAEIGDTDKNRLISLSEFRFLEGLLCTTDATSKLAFLLFDADSNGRVNFENFRKVLSATVSHKIIPFDFESSFVKSYFGQTRASSLDYYEFMELLQSLPAEHARQAFASCDKKSQGSIPVAEYVSLMEDIRGFKMSSHIKENLFSVAGGFEGREVTYPYFKAFNRFLDNLDILEKIVEKAVAKSTGAKATHEQLLAEAQCYSQVTPLQVSLLCELCNRVEENESGDVSLKIFQKLLPRYMCPMTAVTTRPATSSPEPVGPARSSLFHALEPVYRFSLGAIAGAFGALSVYPIDLVKTRMQNQRGSIAGEIMYKSSYDCFIKVVRGEGVLGLYRGILPQLMGVAPEKAIKLAANDTMRDLLRGKDGSLPIWKECIAGGTGGLCQVTFTNPLEIVKIRLQVAGEMAQSSKLGAVHVVKELGFMGLYKGASACFLRDIPFSAIYFPLYAHLKLAFKKEDGTIGPIKLFMAAFIAGVPAAGLLTPADVIKTRLQVKARTGQQTYKGILDCFRKILATEGPGAFFKGVLARICRSSPQFGVTLATYEVLHTLFPVNFKNKPLPTPISVAPLGPIPRWLDSTQNCLPDHIGGYRLARPTISALEKRYSLNFVNQLDSRE